MNSEGTSGDAVYRSQPPGAHNRTERVKNRVEGANGVRKDVDLDIRFFWKAIVPLLLASVKSRGD